MQVCRRSCRYVQVTICLAVSFLFICCTATFTGRVSVKGSEPHTYLAIEIPGGEELEITGTLVDEIRAKFQGRTITVEGTITDKGSGPGFPPKLRATRIAE
ncbi:MAG TPA: hypothetical protein VMW87_06225 [Spirochaetia bacterium]|nr:hypothetical protein [Spirochaetia bacterium]